jgi:integrase
LSRDPLAGRKVKSLREPKGRVRYLLPDEVSRLLRACDSVGADAQFSGPYLRAFVLVAVNTGMRRNEILALTGPWERAFRISWGTAMAE